MKLESIALHHGYSADPTTHAAAVPIYQTTSYTFDDTQHGADLFDLKVAGNIYTRIMNPTTAVLEARIAEILSRYRDSSPVHRAVSRSRHELLASAERARKRLELPNEWPTGAVQGMLKSQPH